ncbi:MAG: SDR family oxidoreductase [Pseudomonadota bacterium]
MMASPVLILGARSDIGRALARAYLAKGASVILAARPNENGLLEDDLADLRVRAPSGVTVEAVPFDVTDGAPDAFFESLPQKPGTVVMVAGLLGEQEQSAKIDARAADVLGVNFSGPARYLLAAARAMEGVAGGCIIGISSVAGDRGRASNYVYGSAKAGLSAFLSGMRNEHAKTGLHVMTVKPGFVATQMTEGMDLPAAMTAQPAEVAAAIIKAQEQRRDEIYVKGRWRFVMAIIRAIPERIFKKLSI